MEQPLTKDKLIDTDESFLIHLTDLDADYVVDIEDVRSALKGLCDEIDSIINDGHEPIIEKLVGKWFPSFS